jgi:pimeloyl-ACP methyl ester carboxylesterase
VQADGLEDLGGAGRRVLFLHGLAGHGGEWAAVARAVTAHAFTLDAPGHGVRDRHPADVSRPAHAQDAAAALAAIGPAVVVGQSLGGQTAICVAALRPELVEALVVVEAGPWGGQFAEPQLDALAGRLRAWPAARRRHFDVDVMVRTMAAFDAEDCWAEWEAATCPALLVLGETGGFAPGEAEEMIARRPAARLAVVEGAGHDVHLDRPAALAGLLAPYLPIST